MLRFFPFASGSKGNCSCVRSSSCNILIDIGLPKIHVASYLNHIGIHPEDIHGIIISHEHGDHISGLKSFVKTFRTPILCNLATAEQIQAAFPLANIRFHIFHSNEPFHFHDMEILPFNVHHDAVDPVGFVFSHQQYRLGYCTDIGFATPITHKRLQHCHTLVIESNHDMNMLQASSKPEIYKQRVMSRLGHLSNEACGQLLQQIVGPELEQLFLAHLSQDNNTPELAVQSAYNYIQHLTKIIPVALPQTLSKHAQLPCLTASISP